MSDEERQEEQLEEQVAEDVVVEEVDPQEAAEERVHSEEEAIVEKRGIIDSIKDKIFGTKTQEEEEEKSVSAPSDKFLEAATGAGFTQEHIEQLAADYTAEELDALIPHLLDADEEEEVEEEKAEEKHIIPLSDEIKEELKPIAEQLRKAMEDQYRERFEQLESFERRLVQHEAEKAVNEFVQEDAHADEFFDRISQDFPVFGQTKELLRFPEGTKKAGTVIPQGPTFEARNEVYSQARLFQKNLGQPWETALKMSFDLYKGRHGEKAIEQKVVKKLKTNETRLSARRSQKETSKVFKNEHQEKLDIIEQAKRRAGIA